MSVVFCLYCDGVLLYTLSYICPVSTHTLGRLHVLETFRENASLHHACPPTIIIQRACPPICCHNIYSQGQQGRMDGSAAAGSLSHRLSGVRRLAPRRFQPLVLIDKTMATLLPSIFSDEEDSSKVLEAKDAVSSDDEVDEEFDFGGILVCVSTELMCD